MLPLRTLFLSAPLCRARFCCVLLGAGVNLHRVSAVTASLRDLCPKNRGEKRQLMRVIRFLLKGLAVLIGLAVLGLIGFYVYLSTRPTPKTIKAAGIITVPAASSFPLKFIDYMFVNGSKLYAGSTRQGVGA